MGVSLRDRGTTDLIIPTFALAGVLTEDLLYLQRPGCKSKTLAKTVGVKLACAQPERGVFMTPATSPATGPITIANSGGSILPSNEQPANEQPKQVANCGGVAYTCSGAMAGNITVVMRF